MAELNGFYAVWIARPSIAEPPARAALPARALPRCNTGSLRRVIAVWGRPVGTLVGHNLRLVVRLVAALHLGFVLAACGRPPSERFDLATELANAVHLAPAFGPIDMTRIAPFDWQTMHVFETCLDQDVIDKSLGFHFDTSPMRNGGYCYDMEVGRPLVVFSSGQTVDGWFILNEDRRKAVFFDADPDGTLTVLRANATFVVRIEEPSERDLARAP